MEPLVEAIEIVKSKVKTHRGYYERVEEAVKQQLIFEILEALGWNVKNPEEVRPEDKTEMGRADYALRLNRKVVAYIEAKNLSTDVIHDKNALKQLGNYCFGKGVNYGILTNGIQWKVIKAFESGKSLEERVLFSVDLERDEVSRGVFLLSLLARDKILRLEEVSKVFKKLEDSFKTLKAFGFSGNQICKVLSRQEEQPEFSENPPEGSMRILELTNVSNTKPIKAFVRTDSGWKELVLSKPLWRELLRQYATHVLNNKGQLPVIPGYVVTEKSQLKNWDRSGSEKSFIQVGSYYLYKWLSATDILRVLKRIQHETGIELAIVLETKKK